MPSASRTFFSSSKLRSLLPRHSYSSGAIWKCHVLLQLILLSILGFTRNKLSLLFFYLEFIPTRTKQEGTPAMKKAFSKLTGGQPSDEPPSYDQLEATQNTNDWSQNRSDAPSYSSNYGPNEYPPEKKDSAYDNDTFTSYPPPPGWQNSEFSGGPNQPTPPQGTYTYTVPPQKANIAYDTEGRHTRPGYAEYIKKDNERISQGDLPRPREAFGRGGAPLAPSKKSLGLSSGFPGSSKTTYYNSSRNWKDLLLDTSDVHFKVFRRWGVFQTARILKNR